MTTLAGKVALVTGSARPLGNAPLPLFMRKLRRLGHRFFCAGHCYYLLAGVANLTSNDTCACVNDFPACTST
jgi:hypothetical protein